MKLGNLFPTTSNLRKTPKKDIVDKAPVVEKPAISLFGNVYGTGSRRSAPSSNGLRQQTKQIEAAGLFSVKWPSMPVQEAKDYQVITNRQDWIEYLKRCKETGYASFDWETAPMQLTRDRWASKQHDFKIRRLQADHEYGESVPGGPKDPKKPTPAEKKFAKLHKDTLATIDKDYAAALKKFERTPLDPWSGEICTLSISAAPHESRVIFISHKEGSRNYGGLMMDREAARAEVLDLLEEWVFQDVDVLKIAYNLPFETKYAAKYGKYIIGKVSDPMVMIIRVLQIVAPQKIQSVKAPYMGKSLKKMTREYTGVKMSEFSDVVKGGFFDELSTDDPNAENYSAEDSDYALQLHLYFDEVAKQIPNDETCPYENYSEWLHAIEMPFGRVIGLMEYWGMEWNSDDAVTKRREAHDMQKDAQDSMRDTAVWIANHGDWTEMQKADMNDLHPGKTGKTKDVKHLLYDILKLPVAATGKTGPSLDNNAILDTIFMLEHKLFDLNEERFITEELPDGFEEILQQFKAGDISGLPNECNPESPNNLERGQRVRARLILRDPHPYADAAISLLRTMQTIQKAGTLLSSHIEGREKYVNENSGRIHANYTPWTQTSRLSSNSPNGQNVPRPDNDLFGIRNLYRAPDGKVLTMIDFSGFELRLMAWRSKCEVMIPAIKGGADLHKMTAATMTGKTLEYVTKSERSKAKSGNFGVNYGGTEHALQDTYKGFGIRETLEYCKSVVDAVLNTYPGIPRYQREVVVQAREDGYVETMYGYKRLLPDINHPSGGRRGSDERRAGNTPIQGAAADYMKDCQNLVYDRIGEDTFAARMIAEIKDNADSDAVKRYEAATGRNLPDYLDLLFIHGQFDMVAQIHDEIIFEVENDKDKVIRGMKWVQDIMERDPLPGFPVQIEAESSAGYTWGTKVDLDKWEVIE